MKGFTLIEVLVSLFIVLLAVLLLGRVLIFSMQMVKISSEKLSLSTQFSNLREELSSRSFSHQDLQAGIHKESYPNIGIEWEVIDLDSSLKKIQLKIHDKKRQLQGYFYNSLLLRSKDK